LATDGKVGECTDYYPLFVAAKECNCTPWALAEQNPFWQQKALIVRDAEIYARAEKAKHQ
jgi:hypothetical protein